jgi:hypothetical protein
VRVTNDTMEFASWPSRKPSKKKIARAAFRSDPVGTSGTLIQQAAKRSVEKAGEEIVRSGIRAGRVAVRSGAGAATREVLVGALPVIGTVGALAAAGILGGWLMDKATDSVGDKINRISYAFVAAQQALIHKTGVRTWQEVPDGPRTKLLQEYKAALAHVARNPGLARFEKTPTFGG